MAAKIQGLQQLEARFNREIQKGEAGNKAVLVGFAAEYAAAVHEMESGINPVRGRPRRSGKGEYWGPKGQAKFLQSAFEDNEYNMRIIIQLVYQRTGDLLLGLLTAGRLLQRESQNRVPYEYGNLFGSSFVEEEEELIGFKD